MGATLIHLLTGISPADLPQKDLRIQFCDRISLSANFTRWVEVMTAPDVEQRFTKASEALEALRSDRYPKFTIATIPKPVGSRIKLKKSADELLIKIPQNLKKLTFLDLLKLAGNFILIAWSIPVLITLTLMIFGIILGLLGIIGGILEMLKVFASAFFFILLYISI